MKASFSTKKYLFGFSYSASLTIINLKASKQSPICNEKRCLSNLNQGYFFILLYGNYYPKKHSWHHRHHFMNSCRINTSGIKNTFLIRPAHFVCKKRAWQHTKFRILNDQQNIKHKQIQITSSKICFVCVHRCSNRIKNGTVLFPATAVLVIFQYTFIYVILRSAAIKTFTKKRNFSGFS